MSRQRGRVVAWAALLTGIGASIAANVGHARPDLGPRLLSALAPVSLALTVEVLARVAWRPGWRSALPRAATVVVGLVAAVASYSHLRGLAIRYGENGLVATILPLAVDGLAGIGALAVVELGRLAVEKTDVSTVAPTTAPSDEHTEPEPDPDLRTGYQAVELLAEINTYLTAEAERLDVARLVAQEAADREAAVITERGRRAGLFASLAGAFRKSGDKPTDEQIRDWLADEADRTGTVPSRADIREFWGKAPNNTRLGQLRREVAGAGAERAAQTVPGTTGQD